MIPERYLGSARLIVLIPAFALIATVKAAIAGVDVNLFEKVLLALAWIFSTAAPFVGG